MVEVTTHMLTLVIRPVAAHTLLAWLTRRMKSENIHIAQAHQVDSQNLDAVIYDSVNTNST